MKHNITITMMLLAFFLLAQVAGLWLINKEAKVSFDPKTNQTVVHFDDTAMGPRPETTGSGSLAYVLIAVAIGTILVLIIVKFGKVNVWKSWFFLAVWMSMCVSIGALIKSHIWFGYDIAIAIALILTFWKIFRPDIFVHNITEVLMYAGIALILVPIFDVTWSIALLLIISLYDMYAVWKSEHMVKMAQFQTKSRVFAGLMIPYKTKSTGGVNIFSREPPAAKTTKRLSSANPKTAILGGGDIAFPLIFTGTVMNGFLLDGLTKTQAFLQSSIIILTTTIALGLLFLYAKKGKFYPAMPFITAGCLIGWAITLLI